MLKIVNKIIAVIILAVSFASVSVYAQGGDPGTPTEASFESRCAQISAAQSDPNSNYYLFPPCASSPSDCGTVKKTDANKIDHWNSPLNCLFLEEPIGGTRGYDLFKVECYPNPTKSSQSACEYTLWHGEALSSGGDVNRTVRGPVQAILTFEEGKEYQGPFGLLYNYIGLIYKYLSGVIVGFVILMSIVGGIRMTTSNGNSEAFDGGKKMIIKALTGMVLWFMSSLILYTINPTFFAF
ncbi:hypothetical protein JW758_05385 [Candidatus Peregrinibacteria bacterium]|nr:hypothetical protein [Candidatus Peregrinibacteria bacterium]